jgi:hypothetical protein
MANRSQLGFEQQLLKDLTDTAENFKNFMFTSGYKNMKVLDPCISIRNMQEEELWETDPVHPKMAAYHRIADSAVWLTNNMETSLMNKRQRADRASQVQSRAKQQSEARGGGGGGETSHNRGSYRSGDRGGRGRGGNFSKRGRF